ncbi:hypothetical protein [Scytonema sp. NUACC21]
MAIHLLSPLKPGGNGKDFMGGVYASVFIVPFYPKLLTLVRD